MSTEYQPRTANRLIEMLRAQDQNPRSWQQEAANMIAAVQWQLIDTAPQDGRHLMLSTDYDPPAWVAEGYYDVGAKGWWSANTHCTDAHDGQLFPTHWMPLPSAHE